MFRTCVLAAAVAAAGCGPAGPVPPAKYPVRGAVTLDGAPLPDGDISFEAEDGLPPAVARVAGGRYEVAVTAGPKVVKVRAYRLKDPPPPEPYDPRENVVPARYNTASALRADVAAGGPNEFSFDLHSR